MNHKKSASSSNSTYQQKQQIKRPRRRIRQPAGHPTDAELIAAYTGTVTRYADGVAMGSMKSTDMGLVI
jgi:hypothetical protein